MERFLQFIQDLLRSITLSNCLFLVLGFALSFCFTWITSTIRSFLRRPRLTCEDEAEYQISSSLSVTSSSSSPSQVPPQIKYDVFISFRGSDTRCGFLSHLLKQLCRKKIEAFVDYKLREGDELSPAFSRAIEKSHIALVIFSIDYASSKWCLDELVQINECRMKYGQIVVPIFYKVDPSDVRYQKGRYKNAFDKHKKFFKGNITKLEKWRYALKEVANLSGFHSTNLSGTEAELIEVVIRRVLTRLKHMYPVDLKGLVGIAEPIAYLRSLIFSNGSEDVRVIGIWGMGGMGKTTIARVLFNTLCSEFEGCCFLANVRERSEGYRIIQLKSELISILLEEENDPNVGIPILVPGDVLSRLGRKKLLVVLDDVDDPNTIKKLIGGHDSLGKGSRIIVTTRNKHVIEKEAGKNIYEVKALGSHDALELLKLHAFNGNHLQMDWHLMWEVEKYAKGVPLALEVLGSFLYGKSAQQWESQLRKLQNMICPGIQNVLRSSFDGLDPEEQKIFLYIACFFEEKEKKANVEGLLGGFGYQVTIALRTLEDKALTRTVIVYDYPALGISTERVFMHDLIREMGRQIVREKSIGNPGKWKHLWNPQDICRVLKYEEGSKHIESIIMDTSSCDDLKLSPRAFDKMTNLKFLRFHNQGGLSKLHLPDGLEILPNNLRFFYWEQYPSKSFPATFNAENLVEFHFRFSGVEKLWDGVQNLPNLKKLDLVGSRQLTELPDLSRASSLKSLDLLMCENLVSVHPSIFSLQNIEVNLSYCARLKELPAIEAFHSKLKILRMEECSSLKRLPDSMSKLRSLEWLDLKNCKELDTSNLGIIFDGLQSLKTLDLDGCRKLDELPENISNLSLLWKLSLSETNVKSLPESIKHLPRLECLYLNKCMRLHSIPEIPPSISHLVANACTSLERVFTPTIQLLEQHITVARENNCLHNKPHFEFKYCSNLDEESLYAALAYAHWCKEGRVPARDGNYSPILGIPAGTPPFDDLNWINLPPRTSGFRCLVGVHGRDRHNMNRVCQLRNEFLGKFSRDTGMVWNTAGEYRQGVSGIYPYMMFYGQGVSTGKPKIMWHRYW